MAVWQTEAHQFHDPSSAADRAQLSMHPEVEALVMTLLECGMKPYNVWWQAHARQITLGSCPGGSLEAASDARWNITLQQVYAVRKKLQRREGYGLTSDAAAVAAQMEALSALGCVLHYQPLRERCDGGSGATAQPRVTIQCEDGLHQPLMIVLQTPFQARMLARFGGRLAFMDATGGTNRYGYMMQGMVVSAAGGSSTGCTGCSRTAAHQRCTGCSSAALAATQQRCTGCSTGAFLGRCGLRSCPLKHPPLPPSPGMQVQDEQGRAVPVGFMISSSDTAEVLEGFLRQLLRGVSYWACS